MSELLLFIEDKQTWIYLIVVIAGLIYLRSFFRAIESHVAPFLI